MSVPKSGTVTIIVITVTQLNPPGTFNIWINRLILSRPFWLTTSSVSREPHGKEARISGVTKMVKKSGWHGAPQGHSQCPCSAEAVADESCLVGVLYLGSSEFTAATRLSVQPLLLSFQPTSAQPGLLSATPGALRWPFSLVLCNDLH